MTKYDVTPGIDSMTPKSGRVLEENNDVVNILDYLRGIGGISTDGVTVQMSDAAGRRALMTMAGEVTVGHRLDDVSINFHYGVSPLEILDGGTVSGTGSIGQQGSLSTVSSGTGIGRAEIRSRQSVRYRAGHETYCILSSVFDAPEANVNQYIGFFDGHDGIGIGYQGAEPGIWLYLKGVVTFVPQSEWNIDPMDGTGASRYNLDLLSAQVTQMRYVWHGFRELTVEITASTGRLHMAHKFEFINQATDTHFANPFLPLAMWVERVSGNGNDITIKTGSWRAGVVIGSEIAPSNRRFDYSNLNVPAIGSATTRQVVLGLRNTTTHRGQNNQVRVEALRAQFLADGSKATLFEAWRPSQGTLGAPLVYSPRDPVSSVIEYSATDTTFEPLPGELSASNIGVGKADNVVLDNAPGTGLTVYPGEEVILTAISPNNTEVGISIQTREYF